MTGTRQLRQLIESSALTAAVICINILAAPEDPGFSSLLYTPYISSSLFCAVFFRRRMGFFSLIIQAAVAVVYSAINNIPFFIFFQKNTLLYTAAALLFIYLFGTIRETDLLKIMKTRQRLRALVRENHRLKRLSSAQLEINRELEERVTRQSVTISSLHNQMHRMDSLNLGKSLDILIETVEIFTEATAVSVWTESDAAGFLQCPASRHISGTFDSSELLPVDSSIEGWVLRNNRKVSARMINNYENLKKINTGRNIITLPIPINKKVWGVLNIEEMPFVKYNQYTEKLLEIIISLAEPALTRAVEHERLIQISETDKDTGLPLFSQLYSVMNRAIGSSSKNGTRLSLLIIEMQNFGELSQSYPEPELKKLFLKLTDEIQMSASGMAQFFMHKSESQMAVLVSGIGEDGTALLCLEILEYINSNTWLIGNSELFLEIIIGYSSLGETADDADGLIKHAEHLLEIQKL